MGVHPVGKASSDLLPTKECGDAAEELLIPHRRRRRQRPGAVAPLRMRTDNPSFAGQTSAPRPEIASKLGIHMAAWMCCTNDRWCVEPTQEGGTMSRIVRSSKAMVLIASLGAVIAAPTARRAQSTDYPNQRISFIVGFAVGGFADTIARWVAIRLGECTGYHVAQNMEGGGGVRAALMVRHVAAGWLHHPRNYDVAYDLRIPGAKSRSQTADAFDAVSLPVSAPASLSASVKSPIKSPA